MTITSNGKHSSHTLTPKQLIMKQLKYIEGEMKRGKLDPEYISRVILDAIESSQREMYEKLKSVVIENNKLKADIEYKNAIISWKDIIINTLDKEISILSPNIHKRKK